jgi:hypothetical protein
MSCLHIRKLSIQQAVHAHDTAHSSAAAAALKGFRLTAATRKSVLSLTLMEMHGTSMDHVVVMTRQ